VDDGVGVELGDKVNLRVEVLGDLQERAAFEAASGKFFLEKFDRGWRRVVCVGECVRGGLEGGGDYGVGRIVGVVDDDADLVVGIVLGKQTTEAVGQVGVGAAEAEDDDCGWSLGVGDEGRRGAA